MNIQFKIGDRVAYNGEVYVIENQYLQSNVFFIGNEKDFCEMVSGNLLVLAIKGTVLRGFITRFNKETEWEEYLSPVKEGLELVDGDASPYYIQQADGKYKEYYGEFTPANTTVYQLSRN